MGDGEKTDGVFKSGRRPEMVLVCGTCRGMKPSRIRQLAGWQRGIIAFPSLIISLRMRFVNGSIYCRCERGKDTSPTDQ